MTRFFALITILFSVFASAQVSTTDEIAASEMQSASALANLAVNPNTQNYDIIYHKLEFTVDPSVYYIEGIVFTTFIALENMSQITFDMSSSLIVSEVTVGTQPLTFSQNDDQELIIDFPDVLPAGESRTVKIVYEGAPGSSQNAFMVSQHNGTPILATLSEPFGARDWWPCKQDLNDKINLIEVFITAPSQYVSVSNGLEISQSITGDMKTTRFRHQYPIPAYLIAIAVTNYNVFTQQAGTAPNTFPIVNYIYPENFDSAQQSLAVTLPIMDLFESLFEPYPFHTEKYGHAQFNYGGGMEHTTVSFMGGFSRNLIAHELAHQWFGNKITCGSWSDIWLNEGFAEYLSGLVIENLDGESSFVNWKANKKIIITSQPAGSVYVPEAEALNVSRIFSSRLSYNKGAMVVHMLRYLLGDADFFQGVRNYLADPELAYGYAQTDDLKFHLEQVSETDLTEFFADYVYGEGHPFYNVTAENSGPNQAKIVIYQGQSHPSVEFFEMRVPITLVGTNGQQETYFLENNSDLQAFIVDVPFEVADVIFDRDNDILAAPNSTAILATDTFDFLQQISIAPNPAMSTLTISMPENLQISNVSIYNVIGQKLHSGNSSTIDVSSLSSGIHIISITTQAGTKSLKFVKE